MKEYNYGDEAYCKIQKNGEDYVWAYTKPGAPPHTGYTTAVNSIYVHLAMGDNVTLGGCTPMTSIVGRGSSFVGFLVTPDAV